MAAGRFSFAALLFLAACQAAPAAMSVGTLSPTTATTPTTTTTAPTTTAAPTTTTAPTTTIPPKGSVVIDGVGDTNFYPNYIRAFQETGYGWAFEGLDGLFLEDDLTIVNLECSPSDLGDPLDKPFTFRCDPAALPMMSQFGVEVANLANNHGQDYGSEAMLDGRQNLIDAGLAPVGVGADVAQATEPAVFEVNGWKVAVIGFGGVVPSHSWIATEDQPGMADGDDTDAMVEAVTRAATVSDFVVVTIHWGVELDTLPRDDDVRRAEAMIAAGADVIFGHHPHRLQPLEMVAGRPVAWSLGNFIWPRLSTAGATTAVARVIISPDGSLEACLIPAEIESSGHPVLTAEPPCHG
jgi:poly-gamma-glutamate synthesis protein (capsule biosynthesis protein)